MATRTDTTTPADQMRALRCASDRSCFLHNGDDAGRSGAARDMSTSPALRAASRIG